MTTVLRREAPAKIDRKAPRECRRCKRPARPGSRLCRHCTAEVDARKRLRLIVEWECPELIELAADFLDTLLHNRAMFPDPVVERLFDEAFTKARRIFLAPMRRPAAVRTAHDPGPDEGLVGDEIDVLLDNPF